MCSSFFIARGFGIPKQNVLDGLGAKAGKLAQFNKFLRGGARDSFTNGHRRHEPAWTRTLRHRTLRSDTVLSGRANSGRTIGIQAGSCRR